MQFYKVLTVVCDVWTHDFQDLSKRSVIFIIIIKPFVFQFAIQKFKDQDI